MCRSGQVSDGPKVAWTGSVRRTWTAKWIGKPVSKADLVRKVDLVGTAVRNPAETRSDQRSKSVYLPEHVIRSSLSIDPLSVADLNHIVKWIRAVKFPGRTVCQQMLPECTPVKPQWGLDKTQSVQNAPHSGPSGIWRGPTVVRMHPIRTPVGSGQGPKWAECTP